MSHYGQVLEDPEYYDAGDQAWDDSLDEEDEVEVVSQMDLYNPFNTVNS